MGANSANVLPQESNALSVLLSSIVSERSSQLQLSWNCPNSALLPKSSNVAGATLKHELLGSICNVPATAKSNNGEEKNIVSSVQWCSNAGLDQKSSSSCKLKTPSLVSNAEWLNASSVLLAVSWRERSFGNFNLSVII